MWAPRVGRVEVEIGNERVPLEAEPRGYHSCRVPAIGAGTRYAFRLDGGPPYPDPASRFQPEGPHGPSEVIDPTDFAWTDVKWRGVPREGQVVYEMHIGTFTPEGTWASAIGELELLAATGITVLEVMPVAEVRPVIDMAISVAHAAAAEHGRGTKAATMDRNATASEPAAMERSTAASEAAATVVPPRPALDLDLGCLLGQASPHRGVARAFEADPDVVGLAVALGFAPSRGDEVLQAGRRRLPELVRARNAHVEALVEYLLGVGHREGE